MNTHTDKRLLTVAQCARRANLCERTVWRYLKEGGCPYRQPQGPGAAVRVDPDEWDRFLARSAEQRIKYRLGAIRARQQAIGNAAVSKSELGVSGRNPDTAPAKPSTDEKDSKR